MTPDGRGPSAAQIFLIAFQISLLSFGGGISAWVFREVVRKKAWVSEVEFLSDMAAARILPGANAVNINAILGYRLLGMRGAVAGIVGTLVGPSCFVIGAFYTLQQIEGPAIDAVMQGAAAGAIGPLAYLMVRNIQSVDRTWYGILILLATAISILIGFSLIITVAVAILVSFIATWIFGLRNAKL